MPQVEVNTCNAAIQAAARAGSGDRLSKCLAALAIAEVDVKQAQPQIRRCLKLIFVYQVGAMFVLESDL